MFLKEENYSLNFIKQCRKYGLSIWQCPGFLFLVIGFVIIISVLVTYFISIQYIQEPQIVALIIMGLAVVLMLVGYFIIRSFERLAQVNQMKSEFISVVSHQLRTPLSSSRWSLNILMDKRFSELNGKQLEEIELIKKNNQKMIDLVNNLLDICRIERGKMGLKPEKISLLKLIKDLILEYGPLVKANNVELSFEAEKDIPDVLADPQRIKFIVHNLINNAIYYIKNNGRVKIRLKKNKNFLRCEIEDNGVGIPIKDQKRIFQKFFRSQNIMRYQTDGTGLGLFIAKAVIRESGGKIGFRSQEGKGSTFWFELPIK